MLLGALIADEVEELRVGREGSHEILAEGAEMHAISIKRHFLSVYLSPSVHSLPLSILTYKSIGGITLQNKRKQKHISVR
jgi:hypothetical protein